MLRRIRQRFPGAITRRTALALALALTPASCGTPQLFTVSITEDGGKGSLRDAIALANASDARTVTIEVPTGTYPLTRCGRDDANEHGDLDLTTNAAVIVTAKGPNVVIRQTCATERVLDAHGTGLLSLRGLTITGGALVGGDPPLGEGGSGGAETSGTPARGGGVRARADVHLAHTSVTFNSATGRGATYYEVGAYGGGLFVGGSLRVEHSLVASNLALGDQGNAEGGGAYVLGTVDVADSSISDNHALGGYNAEARGGGVAQDRTATAPVTLTDTVFSNNSAEGADDDLDRTRGGPAHGGAVASAGPLLARGIEAVENYALGGAYRSSVARGGALALEGSGEVHSSRFSSNQARGSGPPGAGPFEDPVDAAGGALWAAGDLVLVDNTYTANITTGRGGGVSAASVNVSRATFTHNEAGAGGGAIFTGALVAHELTAGHNKTTSWRGGAVVADEATLSDSNVHDNVVDARVRYESDRAAGGGLFVHNLLRLTDTQIVRNVGRAVVFSSNAFFWGAGVYAGAIDGQNVTIADNIAVGRSFSTSAFTSDTVSLVNSTLSGNSTFAGPVLFAGHLELDHTTIVAAGGPALRISRLTSHGSVVSVSGTACPAGVSVESSSYNWFSDASCALTGTGDRQEPVDFGLGALADNGGPVPTLAPDVGSVLIDQIPPVACTTDTDARGVARPQGPACDIGAVEIVQ